MAIVNPLIVIQCEKEPGNPPPFFPDPAPTPAPMTATSLTPHPPPLARQIWIRLMARSAIRVLPALRLN